MAMDGDQIPPADSRFSFPVRSKRSCKYELLCNTISVATRTNKYVIACALFASLNSTLLGYDIGVMNGAVLFIKEDVAIHHLQDRWLVASLNLVTLVGGIIAGRLSDLVGRQKTMAIASFIFCIGSGLMGLASVFSILLLGRLIAGIGAGFNLVVAPVYIAELSPASSRGAMVSLLEIFTNIGILLGYIGSYALSGLSSRINWRLMLGLGAAPAIFLAIAVLLMPESPHWLVLQNHIQEAQKVLLKTSSDKEEADMRMADIMIAAGFTPLDCAAAAPTNRGRSFIMDCERSSNRNPTKSPRENPWLQLLWPVAAVRRMLLVAMGINLFQQFSGIDALIYYSPAVLDEAGIKSQAGMLGATLAVGFAKTVMILAATRWLDCAGRRPLLLISSLGMTVSLATLATGFLLLNLKLRPYRHDLHDAMAWKEPHAAIAAIISVFAISSFVSFFSMGMGPACWVVSSEIFPLKLRTQAMSLAIAVNRLASSTVTLSFLFISHRITPGGTFFVFTGVSVVSVLFIYLTIPETKGKTLEEIESFSTKDQTGSIVELGEAPCKDGNDGDGGEGDNVNLLEENADHDDLSDAVGLSFLKDGSSKEKLIAKVRLIAKQRSSVDSRVGKF